MLSNCPLIVFDISASVKKSVYLLFVFVFQVLLCKKFQVTILRILIDHDMNKLTAGLDRCYLEDDLEIDYLLLPAMGKGKYTAINWLAVNSVNPSEVSCKYHEPHIRTKSGLVCSCKLQNALVCTSHPIGKISFYIATGTMELDGNSPMELRGGGVTTYKKYYEQQWVIIFGWCLSQVTLSTRVHYSYFFVSNFQSWHSIAILTPTTN